MVMRTALHGSIRDRHPKWPMTSQGDVPDFGDRKLGKRQLEVLKRTVEAYGRLQRGLTAPDLGASTPQARQQIYICWNSLAARGLVVRDPPGVRGCVPAPGADRFLLAELREHAEEEPAPKARVLFTKRITPASATGTAFPNMVVPATGFPFQPGANSGKLGDKVTKGRWLGMPLYSLTLEERATCPRSCAHWLDCYGNGSPQSKRYQAGPELEDRIRSSLWDLDRENPNGYVIRLHMLGDFYSVAYAMMWRELMAQHPQLHVFGYTAHAPDSEIGRIIRYTRLAYRERWAVRFSGSSYQFSARTIHRMPDRAKQAEGLVCPEQRGKLPNCGACGFCWEKSDPVVFIDHALLGDRE